MAMIKKQLNITLLQSSLFWEDRDQNLAHLGKLIDSIEGETDIILLPEMFSSGFSMRTTRVALGAASSFISSKN